MADKKKHISDQSKSQGNFHNLELLCKVDDKQKRTLERIIKQKPELAKSLNIYADGVKYYIAKQQQRDRLLALRDVSPSRDELPLIKPVPLLTHRKIMQETPNLRLLSESLDRRKETSNLAISPHNYIPFANREKLYIPALDPPRNKLYNVRDMQKLKFNYCLGQGNNVELVKQVLIKRESHWTQVPSSFAYRHFTWQQSYFGMDYQKCIQSEGPYSRVMYNFFEFHKQITTKTGLTTSLLQYIGSVERTFQLIPIVFMINFKYSEWMNEVSQFTQFYLQNNPFKDNQAKNSLNFDFYISNLQSPKVNTQDIVKFQLQDTLKSDTQYLWLLKPADWNRGEGVHVFSTLEELEQLIKQYYHGKGNYECREFVIQKYIEKPLLLAGRKFDIRCWALVTHEQQFFLFKEAYIRTSGAKFDLDSKDKFVHLTNNAIQKFCDSYGQFEDGNQLSLEQFQAILDQQGDKLNFREESWAKIKNIIKLSLQSTRINKRNRKYCMQFFGYDFMIDEAYNVWLIEINANPCIEESSRLLKMLLPRMIDDAFKLTIDQIFTPDTQFPGVYKVDNYKDDENMWECLGYC